MYSLVMRGWRVRFRPFGAVLVCGGCVEGGAPVPEVFSPPVVFDTPPEFDAYFGDPHVHTGVSADACASDLDMPQTGCGAFASLADSAAAAGLDWMAITDHVNGTGRRMDEGAAELWRQTVDAALAATEVLMLPGAEVELGVMGASLGHRTVLFFDDTLEGVVRDDAALDGGAVEVASCAVVEAWAARLTEVIGPTLLVPHHPAASSPMPTDWSCLTDLDAGVEVYSRWGNSMGVISAEEPFALYDPIRGPGFDTTEVSGTVHEAVTSRSDHPLGFFAGSDQHHTRPGTSCAPEAPHFYGGGVTGVLLPAGTPLGRTELWTAMVSRHTFATTGPLAAVSVAVFDPQGTYQGGMGDIISGNGAYTLRVSVADPETWDEEVTGVTAILPVEGNPAGELRSSLLRLEAGVYEGEVNVPQADAGGATALYVEVAMDGLGAHPADCVDDAEDAPADSTERLWMSPMWFE